jgi:hypothetical protein
MMAVLVLVAGNIPAMTEGGSWLVERIMEASQAASSFSQALCQVVRADSTHGSSRHSATREAAQGAQPGCMRCWTQPAVREMSGMQADSLWLPVMQVQVEPMH